MAKPSLPQGTRDFSAAVVRKRNYILSTIRNVFELYGFQPLETPAMENLETLMGKYGEEGDKLIFKILNNGLNDPKNADKAKEGFEKMMEGKNSPALTERALKYDLTIPFARYVAMNHGQLTFPFKRYQVQPVWRADRPQKGRYREFTQCDADVVGSKSLLNEIELANIYHESFVKLGLTKYQLKLNSRNILTALAELCGGADKMIDISTAIDKLDKIGVDKVKEELLQRGLTQQQVATIEQYLSISGSNVEKLAAAEKLFTGNDAAAKGLAELRYVCNHCENVNIDIDFTLARGLNYYTGVIFEAKAPADVKMGSIGGGGRYDNLTGSFGVPDIAGVGISFGIDRIYDVMEELSLFPDDLQIGTKVLFFNLGEAESLFAFKAMQELRRSGISCELFHETAKMDKQFKYAEKKGIPFAVIIGSKEIETGNAVVKNLSTAQQEAVAVNQLSLFFHNKS
ncbi:MAG: histidine--tRNA ligase [Bacteroidetes bacterium]|nr:histidine--tRNA ligase [Bacteroidota bacterium]